MPRNPNDSPDIRIQPAPPDGRSRAEHDGHPAWTVLVNGREIRRFPNRETAQSYVHRQIRDSRL